VPTHTVKAGECMAQLAAFYGFASWKTLYDDPGNEALRKKRPNPNLLAPGDVVTIPDKKPKELEVKAGASHRFKVALPKAKLRIYLRGLVGEKLAAAKYKLEIDGKTLEGTTDGEGLLELSIPPQAMTAKLEVALTAPPEPPKPSPDGLDLPKETFKIPKEPNNPARGKPLPTAIVWELSLGALGPVETVSGLQSRLHNLGYHDAVTGADNAETAAAVRAFQADRKLTLGNVDDPTRAELEKVHDKGAP
jgi:Putative peptidoglycan binding domain